MTSATQSSGVLALALRWNYFFSAALAVGVYFRLWLLPTAPWRSNSGNLFAGLIANILCGGVADQSNIEGVLPRLRAIFERLGCWNPLRTICSASSITRVAPTPNYETMERIIAYLTIYISLRLLPRSAR